MYAQVTGGTSEQYIAQLLPLTLAEGVERVACQHGVDGRVVKRGYLVTALAVALTTHQARQLAWSGVGEDVAVGHMHSSFVGLDDDACHH